MKFIDDKSNKLSWWNRNYFYLGTFLVIALNVLVFVLLGHGSTWTNQTLYKYQSGTFLDMRNFFNAFVAKFGHTGWVHLLGNCIGTALAGFYLERKTGSFNFLLLTLGGCMLSAMAQVCFNIAIYPGFSCVTFFLFACLFVDYLFSFEKSRRNKTNIILGAILIVLIYVDQMCLDFADKVVFYPWPYQLITNPGHYSGFIAGLIVGLAINIAKLKVSLQSTPDLEVKVGERAKKVVYSLVAVFMVAVSALCVTLSLMVNSRKTITLSIYDCTTENTLSVKAKVTSKQSESVYLEDFLDSKYFNEDKDCSVQFFTDKTCKTPAENMWNFEPTTLGYTKHKVYPYSNSHVPLLKSTKQNYYIKTLKTYAVTFTGDLTYKFDEVENLVNHSIIPARYNYYSTSAFRAWNFVEQGKDFTFNLNNLKGKRVVTVSYINSLGQSVPVTKGEDGTYTIPSVGHDLIINLQ